MANAEDAILRLQQQASGATGAMAKLEAQIAREARAMGLLGDATGEAMAKLREMQNASDGSKKAEAGILRQAAAMQSLADKARAARAAVATLGGGKDAAAQIDAAKAAEKASGEARRAKSAEDKELRKQASEAKRIAKEEERQAKESERVMTRKRAIVGILGKQYNDYANAAQSAGGPLGAMAGKVKQIATVMGEAGGKGAGAAIMGVNLLAGVIMKLIEYSIAAVAVLVALAAAATLYALHAADAARSSDLLNRAAAAGAKDQGELTMVINDIANKVPLAKSKIAEFGRALEVAGLQGRRMQVALEAISMIESAIPGAGAKIEELAKRFQLLKRAVLTKQDLAGTGLGIDDVAKALANMNHTSIAAAKAALQNGTAGVDAVLKAMQVAIEAKFGKTIAAQMLALSTQFDKFKENLAGLFSGINLEAFLGALKDVLSVFSQTTVTGQALKALMTAVFQGVFDTLAKVLPYVRTFFLGLLIGALQVYIALKPTIKAFAALFASGNGDGLSKALFAGRVAAEMLGIALEFMMQVLSPIIEDIKLLGEAWDWISTVGANILGFLGIMSQLPNMALNAAVALADGFINGIQSKLADVVAAVSGMGEAAEGALRAALGWHSPATLGVDAAVAVGEGVEVGADKAEGNASDAMGSLVNPKAIKSGAKGAKGAGKVTYIENVYIGSRDDFFAFVSMLRNEGEVETLGGEPA